MNEWIIYKGVYRTAPATSCLLKTKTELSKHKNTKFWKYKIGTIQNWDSTKLRKYNKKYLWRFLIWKFVAGKSQSFENSELQKYKIMTAQTSENKDKKYQVVNLQNCDNIKI